MREPLFSIIIPAYNGAGFLGETIQSVLNQTYSHWELIIVDDASPDHTVDVIKQFDDPRIRYICHEQNRGSEVARKTGLEASSGEIVAFLDQDDLFHPEKLGAHVEFLEKHPEVDVTYNARFEIFDNSTAICDLYVPPSDITLADLVIGFPLSPSDVVFRRTWAFQMDLINGSLTWCGGEIVHYSRLFLSGCKFARIDLALNYRRYHSERVVRDLEGGSKSELYSKDKILDDPRCPSDVLALRSVAHTNTYLTWAYLALVQGETLSGQRFIREAIRSNPSLIAGEPCQLVDFMVASSTFYEKQNHRVSLERIFTQLPPELSELAKQFTWAVGRGHLLKGTRALMWGRHEDGRDYFEQAAGLGAQIDESFLRQICHNLLNYEGEFGAEAAQGILKAWEPYLEKIGGRAGVRWLKGCYSVNRAFQSYRAKEYIEVPRKVMRAIANDPKYLANRGVLSILIRSTIAMWSKSPQVT